MAGARIRRSAMSAWAIWKMSRRRMARARYAMSAELMPFAQVAPTSDPMLVPMTSDGVRPRSSRARSTPI
jgi:hypothetical protein